MTPIAEAIRLLRREARYYRNPAFTAPGEVVSEADECQRAADALASYFREPQPEELQRLAQELQREMTASTVLSQGLKARIGIAAVLRAISGDEL